MTNKTTLSRSARAVRNAAAAAATKATKAQATKRSRSLAKSKTPPAKAAPAPKAKKASPGSATKVARAVRAMTFALPFRGSVKEPRPNSKRAKVLAMLQSPKGATHAEVMKAIGWDRVTAYEGIRLLSIHNGYGLREENGRIHAFVEAKKSAKRSKASA